MKYIEDDVKKKGEGRKKRKETKGKEKRKKELIFEVRKPSFGRFWSSQRQFFEYFPENIRKKPKVSFKKSKLTGNPLIRSAKRLPESLKLCHYCLPERSL